MSNIKATASAPDTMITIFSYCNKGWLVPLNDWEDPHYFITAFFCLFLFRNGGHFVQRKRPISLKAWLK